MLRSFFFFFFVSFYLSYVDTVIVYAFGFLLFCFVLFRVDACVY